MHNLWYSRFTSFNDYLYENERKATSLRVYALCVDIIWYEYVFRSGSGGRPISFSAGKRDPLKMGWMRGFPTPEDKQLRFADGSFFEFPALRWSVVHMRELMPTVNVSRGSGAADPLPERQVLDMTTSLKFSEDYANTKAEIWTYSAAGNPLPKPEAYKGPVGYYEALQTIEKAGPHGEAFGYKTPNADVAG